MIVILGLALGQIHAQAPDDPTPQDREFFEAKIRPILVARCYECHSAQAKVLRGGLRLDSRAGVRKGGDIGPAIDREKPEDSLLLQAIRQDDPLLQMPPKGKLPDEEIALLTEWVKRGAPDTRAAEPPIAAAKPKRVIDLDKERQHWAYQPLSITAPPPVRNESWCRTEVDRFILAKLEAKGIAPSAPAHRRTLMRRATFDLTGLPPTPEEVDAFVTDTSPQAFEHLIDRLLESPRYGERWARHWLDLARWAESHGFEHDYDRPTAYHYRDFVIEALNNDLPYDTFVKWQLAGDEYEPDNHLALKATGFLGAGTHSTQITKNQVEKERYDELDDMLSTTGTAFLGLTLGCARCHDHKFDPIATRDYYRMLSTFTTTVRTEVDLVPNPEKHRKDVAEYEQAHRPYVEALARFEQTELPVRLEAWEHTYATTPRVAPRWVVLEPSKFESKGGAKARRLSDGSWLLEGPNAQFDVYTITAACDLAEITAIKIEALSDNSLVAGGPGRAPNGNFALTNLSLKVGPRYGIGATSSPTLINPKATFEQNGLPVAAVVDNDPKSGWAVDPQFGKNHGAVFELGSTMRTDSGCTLTFILEFNNNHGHNIGRIRVSATDSPRPVGIEDDGVPANLREILALKPESRTPEQKSTLLGWYKSVDMKWRALNQEIEDHARTAPKSEGVKALICSEGLPALRLHTQGDDFLPQTHLLRRGDPNQKEEVVTQGFLQAFTDAPDSEQTWQSSPPDGWRTSYRRRALAEWMTDTDKGAGRLLARVIVNRLWQHHFGRGLVATPSDFGTQGARPTHPELLDWLATRLIQEGWRLKPIHKLIMSSSVYQQTCDRDPARSAIDPENELWYRRDQLRLEAEAIHDSMLSVAGLLDTRMYGPGTLDEFSRRRAIYFTIKRSRPISMMLLFDAPDGMVPIAARTNTTVAPQALYLMNSPVVREWAAAFAARVLPSANEPLDAGIDRAYRLAFGRLPSDDERSRAREFITAGTAPLKDAFTDFCQVLFSTSEFTFIE